MAAVFVLNGFGFASLFSRVPDVRGGLDLDNGGLGLLLLVGAAGSVLALPERRRPDRARRARRPWCAPAPCSWPWAWR